VLKSNFRHEKKLGGRAKEKGNRGPGEGIYVHPMENGHGKSFSAELHKVNESTDKGFLDRWWQKRRKTGMPTHTILPMGGGGEVGRPKKRGLAIHHRALAEMRGNKSFP